MIFPKAVLLHDVPRNLHGSFQKLLEKYRTVFHSSRTAKSLEAHYYRMKRDGKLKDDVSSLSESKVCFFVSLFLSLFLLSFQRSLFTFISLSFSECGQIRGEGQRRR